MLAREDNCGVKKRPLTSHNRYRVLIIGPSTISSRKVSINLKKRYIYNKLIHVHTIAKSKQISNFSRSAWWTLVGSLFDPGVHHVYHTYHIMIIICGASHHQTLDVPHSFTHPPIRKENLADERGTPPTSLLPRQTETYPYPCCQPMRASPCHSNAQWQAERVLEGQEGCRRLGISESHGHPCQVLTDDVFIIDHTWTLNNGRSWCHGDSQYSTYIFDFR